MKRFACLALGLGLMGCGDAEVPKKPDLGGAVNKMGDAAKDAAGDMKDAAKDAVGDIKDAAKDAAGDVKDATKDAVGEVKDAVEGAKDAPAEPK